MLHIIWYIIVGFIVGLIARAIMPGAQHVGFIMTTLLGIAGSVVGGFMGRLFSKPEPVSTFHPAGFIMSIMSANTLPASTMWQPWSPLKGTTILAERIVFGSSEMGECSSFVRMSSTASRLMCG